MRKNIKLLIILFLISVGIGFLFSYVSKKKNNDVSFEKFNANTQEVVTENSETVQTSSKQVIITPKTLINLEIKHEDCKHTETKEFEAPEELINLNEEEFSKKYPNIEIKEFSENEVDLVETESGLCGNHFKITTDENKNIIVYKLTSDYDTEVYEETEIASEYLSSEDQKNLEERNICLWLN